MTIKIASRSSKLALAQVEEFVSEYQISNYEIIKIKTEGDKKSARGETQFDKAHFVTDIQKCLLSGQADCAVHSAKDTPARKTESINRTFLLSKTAKDILIFRDDDEYDKEMRLGTSSLRRKLQAKYHLGSKNIFDLSGNVDTRLEKLRRGDYDCIILAKAGIERLKILEELKYKDMNWITASGQGTLAIETTNNFNYFNFNNLNEVAKRTNISINSQRIVLDKINAGCNSAISIKTNKDDMRISGEIYGKTKYISFSGSTSQDTIENIKKQNGLMLLNEHY
tara:strand:+ start:812 stop:1657 length:846 start_codon:yes stop_codon:yes gene_type:complete